jgi:hypothetical protein
LPPQGEAERAEDAPAPDDADAQLLADPADVGAQGNEAPAPTAAARPTLAPPDLEAAARVAHVSACCCLLELALRIACDMWPRGTLGMDHHADPLYHPAAQAGLKERLRQAVTRVESTCKAAAEAALSAALSAALAETAAGCGGSRGGLYATTAGAETAAARGLAGRRLLQELGARVDRLYAKGYGSPEPEPEPASPDPGAAWERYYWRLEQEEERRLLADAAPQASGRASPQPARVSAERLHAHSPPPQQQLVQGSTPAHRWAGRAAARSSRLPRPPRALIMRPCQSTKAPRLHPPAPLSRPQAHHQPQLPTDQPPLHPHGVPTAPGCRAPGAPRPRPTRRPTRRPVGRQPGRRRRRQGQRRLGRRAGGGRHMAEARRPGARPAREAAQQEQEPRLAPLARPLPQPQPRARQEVQP